MNPIPLHLQLSLDILRRELDKNPQKAKELALNYYEDWLTLSEEYKSLSQQNQELIALNQKLQNPSSSSKFSFLHSDRALCLTFIVYR